MAEALNHAEYVARRDRAPEFLGDLMEHTAEVLAEAGIPRERAEVFGLAVALRLRTRWAKQNIYFAEGRSIDLRSRNQQIWDEFNGRNYDELAAKYGFSVVWVRRIIEAMRAAYQAETQGALDLE